MFDPKLKPREDEARPILMARAALSETEPKSYGAVHAMEERSREARHLRCTELKASKWINRYEANQGCV